MNYENFIVAITLEAACNRDNVFRILTNGSSIDMHYYKEDDNGYQTITSSIEEAMDCLSASDSNSILAKIDDTFLALFFLNDNGKFKIMISPASFYHKPWETKSLLFENNYLDVARYTETALQLCSNFKILNVLAEYIS